MKVSGSFSAAVSDYRFLLGNRYPPKTVHGLVSTRYALSARERSMLYRGIFRDDEASSRRSRLVSGKDLENEILLVDGYNVLITVASYLQGIQLYLADDGLLRDTLEGHGGKVLSENLGRAAALTGAFIEKTGLSAVTVYLDGPLEKQFLMEGLVRKWGEKGLNFQILIDDSPDHPLRNSISGILATSDSDLIDRSPLPVFDLARAVLDDSFSPVFQELSSIGR